MDDFGGVDLTLSNVVGMGYIGTHRKITQLGRRFILIRIKILHLHVGMSTNWVTGEMPLG